MGVLLRVLRLPTDLDLDLLSATIGRERRRIGLGWTRQGLCVQLVQLVLYFQFIVTC